MQSDLPVSNHLPVPEGLETRYDNLTDWVTQQFNPIYRRSLGGEYRWCAQWWRHAEAIVRLSALWYAWESLRLQGAPGIGLWFRDHLDHQLPILMGPRGPFYQCSESQHFDPHQASLEPPVDGWWDPEPPAFFIEDPDETTDEEILALLRKVDALPVSADEEWEPYTEDEPGA